MFLDRGQEARRAVTWESVLLVGEAETVAAARSWHEAIWTRGFHVREPRHDAEGGPAIRSG
ncbi:hypothetical protein [Streptomyces sp. NPDC003635]